MNLSSLAADSSSMQLEHASQGEHGHQAKLDDGLDFVNTLAHDRGHDTEHLPSMATALEWFREHDLLHADAHDELARRFGHDAEAAQRALARIQRVRGAMRELVDASVERRPPEGKALDRVNRALRTPYSYYLVPSPDGFSLDHRHEGDPVEGALARLAESIAREVSQGHPERLRICANDECRWVFNDTSPTNRRKWCDMTTCGNRAKAARHRERQRVAGESGNSPGAS
ncbi:MAG: CGNR zinc finger domain-containing protein [Chloroflexota bacterium]|nr:CGNR zinc finger domain-containing protein [Chloroflexota bacterium]